MSASGDFSFFPYVLYYLAIPSCHVQGCRGRKSRKANRLHSITLRRISPDEDPPDELDDEELASSARLRARSVDLEFCIFRRAFSAFRVRIATLSSQVGREQNGI